MAFKVVFADIIAGYCQLLEVRCGVSYQLRDPCVCCTADITLTLTITTCILGVLDRLMCSVEAGYINR